jgi:hypothetical protein
MTGSNDFVAEGGGVIRACALMGPIGGAVAGVAYGLANAMAPWAIPFSLMIFIPLGCFVGMVAGLGAIGVSVIVRRAKRTAPQVIGIGAGGGLGASVPVLGAAFFFGSTVHWFELSVISVAGVAFMLTAWVELRSPTKLDAAEHTTVSRGEYEAWDVDEDED